MSNIVKLDDRTHVLKRPARYIGSVVPIEQERPILKNNQITFDTIEYVPAFIKIVREIIDNSVDAIIKYKIGNTLKVICDTKKVIVEDNGCGIPVKKIKDQDGNELDILAPMAVWTQLKTGSNFDDDADDIQIGQNGEGSTLTNIFSTKFIGITDDGNQKYTLTCKNNMDMIDGKVSKSSGITGTTVTFYPDFEKLNMGNQIDEIYQDLIKFELIYLAATYPQIDFYFNKRKIKIKSFRQLYNEYFPNDVIMTETDHLMVGFSHSEDGWKFIHFINGINVFNGGKVLDYADSQIIGALTDKLQKRYPNIKRNDVKNKVIFHYVVKELPLPRFADQIKSESVNLPSQYPEIAEEVREIASSRFIDKVYKDKSITGPIIDLFKAKEAIKDKKDLEKSVKKIKRPLKYWAAQGDKKYLVISEGDSAIGSIINGVGRKGYGFYPIKGKTSNVLKDPKKLKSDKELLEISNILGIDFSNNQNTLNYENIVIASDADFDGSHISALLLSFFYLTSIDYLKEGRIYRFLTPIAITYKNNKIDKMFFDMDELKKYEESKPRGVIYDYKKGLGSLEEEEWEELFKRYTFDDLLLQIKIETPKDEETLIAWMNEEKDFRKKIIKDNINKFDINML